MKMVAEISKELVERLLCSGLDGEAPDYPFIVEGDKVFLRYDELRISPEGGSVRFDFCHGGRLDATWTAPMRMQDGVTFSLGGLEGRLPITIS